MKFDLTNEELKEIAIKNNKTVEEVANDYKYALKDLEYSKKEINSIIDKHHYVRFPDDLNIFGYGINGELNDKYSCYDGIKELLTFSKDEIALVTGFGPTNPPTIPRIIFFKRLLLEPINIDANHPATAPIARDISNSVIVPPPFNLLYY